MIGRCRHCKQGIFLIEGRWQHMNGFWICTDVDSGPITKAEPEDAGES